MWWSFGQQGHTLDFAQTIFVRATDAFQMLKHKTVSVWVLDSVTWDNGLPDSGAVLLREQPVWRRRLGDDHKGVSSPRPKCFWQERRFQVAHLWHQAQRVAQQEECVSEGQWRHHRWGQLRAAEFRSKETSQSNPSWWRGNQQQEECKWSTLARDGGLRTVCSLSAMFFCSWCVCVFGGFLLLVVVILWFHVFVLSLLFSSVCFTVVFYCSSCLFVCCFSFFFFISFSSFLKSFFIFLFFFPHIVPVLLLLFLVLVVLVLILVFLLPSLFWFIYSSIGKGGHVCYLDEKDWIVMCT